MRVPHDEDLTRRTLSGGEWLDVSGFQIHAQADLIRSRPCGGRAEEKGRRDGDHASSHSSLLGENGTATKLCNIRFRLKTDVSTGAGVKRPKVPNCAETLKKRKA